MRDAYSKILSDQFTSIRNGLENGLRFERDKLAVLEQRLEKSQEDQIKYKTKTTEYHRGEE